MPSFNTSALVQGREALAVSASAGFGSEGVRTGGGVALPLDATASISAGEAVDGYEYRNMEVTAGLRFGMEIRDAHGRLKWADEDCKCREMGGES